MKMQFFIVLVMASGVLGCASKNGVTVDTVINSQRLLATVDSNLAAYFVAEYLQGSGQDISKNLLIAGLCDTNNPSTNELHRITAQTSHDFVALCLAEKINNIPANRRAQEIFSAWQQTISESSKADEEMNGIPDNLQVLFVPGWLYRSDETTGADFRKQRALFSKNNVPNSLIAVRENGSVEENADIIAKQLAPILALDAPLVIVSASKGGPEVAWALHQLREQLAANKNMLVWVNVGGVLRGTMLADKGTTWPWRWFAKLFILQGRPLDGVGSLRTDISQRRAAKIGKLENVTVINYVGVPMTSQVANRARLGFNLMRGLGPNDGLTFITDEIQSAENVHTIVEIGLDHYFAHDNIDEKTLALMRTALDLWGSK